MIDFDYQILKIIYRNNGKARLKYIQQRFKDIRGEETPLSTINSCLERLEKLGYVNWVRYSPILLTDDGLNLAKELIRHAQLLEVLLYNELRLTAEDAHIESEKFNLMLSCETINKICEKYNHPIICPCGDKILSAPNCYCIVEIDKY
jgi:DtxR family Mn-dependent transcriptional regulator